MLAGCATRAWDVAALEHAHPALARHAGHRLDELHPYVWVQDAEVTLFTCRWTTEAPIGVWISAGFDERERALAERALAAWEQAGLGVRFQSVRVDEASLALTLQDQAVETADGAGAGRAVVDCAVSPPSGGGRLAAELAFARVDVAQRPDPGAVPGVVDQHVDPPVRLDHGRPERGRRLPVVQVDRTGRRPSLSPLDPASPRR